MSCLINWIIIARAWFLLGILITPSAANRPLPAVRLHSANDPFDGQHVLTKHYHMGVNTLLPFLPLLKPPTIKPVYAICSHANA